MPYISPWTRSLKSSIAVGIWSLAYSLIIIVIFVWQTGVMNYCWSIIIPNAKNPVFWLKNDCSFLGSSYAATRSLIEGLQVIQYTCILLAFLLIFVSISLIYGVQKNLEMFVWPWFPVMFTSALSSLSYCLWWNDYVSDYWVAICFVQFVTVFINIVCGNIVWKHYSLMKLSTSLDKADVEEQIKKHLDSIRDLLKFYDARNSRGTNGEVPPPYETLPKPISSTRTVASAPQFQSTNDRSEMTSL